MFIRTITTIALIIMILSCGEKQVSKNDKQQPQKNTETFTLPKSEPLVPKEKPKVTTYEVLRRWSIPAGGIGMEILVSDTTTKNDVLALARKLRNDNLSKGYIFISIFDSREACARRLDESYPEKKLFKHYLVQITVNPNTGFDKINWMAEGRPH